MKFSQIRLRIKFIKLYLKIVKETATPEYIARGWAIGMFYGCMIPFGLQLLCSIPTAFILKGSKIGATLGTLLTNHFTIFFIYPIQCYVGARILQYNLTFDQVNFALMQLIAKQDFEALASLGSEILLAFFLGGFILTAIMTPMTYYFVKCLVTQYRKRQKRKEAINQAIKKN